MRPFPGRQLPTSRLPLPSPPPIGPRCKAGSLPLSWAQHPRPAGQAFPPRTCLQSRPPISQPEPAGPREARPVCCRVTPSRAAPGSTAQPAPTFCTQGASSKARTPSPPLPGAQGEAVSGCHRACWPEAGCWHPTRAQDTWERGQWTSCLLPVPWEPRSPAVSCDGSCGVYRSFLTPLVKSPP